MARSGAPGGNEVAPGSVILPLWAGRYGSGSDPVARSRVLRVNEAGTSFQHSTGDEFLISYEDAAKLLAGKGRRAFEIVEVIEEDEREDVPKVAFESEEQASD